MNNTTETNIGIDSVISSVQSLLHTKLTQKWRVDIDSYGRVYRNINNGEVVPEWYYAYNEYKDVMYNDKYPCMFMFIDNENHTTEDELVFVSSVKCVVMLDLSRVFHNVRNRADAKAHQDVTEVLRDISFGRFKIKSIDKGLKNVFNGFKTDNIKFSDTHPYHCFSVNVDLSYYIEDSCN